MFLKNAWYVAAWDHEVTADKPFGRLPSLPRPPGSSSRSCCSSGGIDSSLRDPCLA